MSGDYLWDRDGDDAEVARLEGLLGTYAHRAPLVEPPPRRPRRGKVWLGAGVVAAVAVAAIVVVLVRKPDRPRPPPQTASVCEAPEHGFPFAIEGGDARCGGAPSTAGTLPVGAWLETPPGAQATVQVADIGEVRLGEASRLRLVASGPTEHRLELAQGRLSARVSAPPRLFVVDTPAATAFDLGCAYDLSVEPDGRTRLAVTHGAVSLEGGGRTAFVPWGSEVMTVAGRGPGTPVATGAPAGFVAAVDRLDRASAAERPAALEAVLATASEHDAITVFNLLANAPAAERAHLLARLDELVPRPEWVLTDELLAGKPEAFAAMREALADAAWFAPPEAPDAPEPPGAPPAPRAPVKEPGSKREIERDDAPPPDGSPSPGVWR